MGILLKLELKIWLLYGLLGVGAWGSTAFYHDNDSYRSGEYPRNPDEEYSSGVRLTQLISFDQQGHWRGLSLGNYIFTPPSSQLAVPPNDERPYAGWLALGFGQGISTNRHAKSTEYSIGLVGKGSSAEEIQAESHQFINYNHDPLGWDNQIPTEVTFNFFTREDWKLFESQFLRGWNSDFWAGNQWALGSYQSYLGGQVHWRFGWNVPTQEPFEINRLDYVSYALTANQSNAWSIYGTIGANAKYVFRSLPLEGNLFRRHEIGISPERLVGELEYGVVIEKAQFSFVLEFVIRSREYKEQQTSDQKYRAIKIAYHY